MTWLIPAAAIAALLALAVGWWLVRGRGGRGIESPEQAVTAADAAVAGFAAHTALIGVDRCTALVLGAQARVAVLRARGSRIAAREIGWSDIRATHGGIRVESGDRQIGTVTIEGIDALDIRRAGGDAMAPRAGGR